MRLLEYDRRDEERYTKNVADREKRLVSLLRKRFDENRKEGFNVRDRYNGAPVMLEKPREVEYTP